MDKVDEAKTAYDIAKRLASCDADERKRILDFLLGNASILGKEQANGISKGK